MISDVAMSKKKIHPRYIFIPVWDRCKNKIEVDLNTGCWMWTAAKSRLGYAHIRLKNKIKEAHIIIYKKYNGEIPEGLELDHICKNRSCVNPSHLEPVTHAENMKRGINATKTHCIRGHELTEENIYKNKTNKTKRNCKLCNKERVMEKRKNG